MNTLFAFLALQVLMGAFDTLFHHEFTERLSARPSAARELAIHGVRNAIYALVFASLGWCEWRGALAWAFAGLLVIELALTLWDFLVEARTRLLPASERITHTLLALNYGVILALLAPELWRWALLPTGFALVDHGLWSWVMGAIAVAVLLWGGRDLARAQRLGRAPAVAVHLGAAELVRHLPAARSVLITGGTGFIGERLAAALIAAGHRVAILTRDKRKAAFMRGPVMLLEDLDALGDEVAFDAIVNLAGEPTATGRWTAAKRRRLLDSRLAVTEAVLRLIARARVKPAVLVNGSAIGIYGTGEAAMADAPAFAQELCEAWERAAMKAEQHGVRVVCLRIGLVLGASGGPLGQMLLPFELGLGGRLGDGRQWMSWIHRDDLVALIAHAIADPAIRGPLDATAPHPVRNREFTQSLGRALGRPAILPVPAALLRLLLGRMADEILLSGPRVLPAKAMASGFAFRYPTLEAALAEILHSSAPMPMGASSTALRLCEDGERRPS